MKKLNIFFFLVFYCNLVTLFSQDTIDPPKLNSFLPSSQYTSLIYRGTAPFIFGWNWSSKCAALDSALLMNTYHDFPMNETDIKPDLLVIQNTYSDTTNHVYKITAGYNADVVLNAHCLHLEPTLTVDSTQNFKPRFGDNTGAVFGWFDKNVGDTVGLGNDDFSRYLLNKNSVTTPTLVLSNIWKGDILKWLDYDGNEHKYLDSVTQDSVWTKNIGRTNDSINHLNTARDIATYHPFNGKQWYCSVNLRAGNQDSIEAHLNDTILVIRVKYILTHFTNASLQSSSNPDTSYVKFDMIPDTSRTKNDSIISTVNDNFRGIFRSLRAVSPRPTEFAITGRMLKNLDPQTPNGSITLSAFANFTGRITNGVYENNPLLKNMWWENRYQFKDYITKFDVEVTYYGKLDVNLDWVRIETPRCQSVLRSRYDDSIRQAVDYIFSKIAANPKNPKLFRFYGDDEMVPSQWLANRYFNMLVDTLASLETFVSKNNPKHYLYATGFKEYWNGDVMRFDTEVFNPFIKKGKESAPANMFGYRGGYAGNDEVTFTNTKDSPYETFLKGYSTSLPITDTLMYEHNNSWPHDNFNYNRGLQFNVENLKYDNFFKNPSLIYNDKPWWANLWVQSEEWKDYQVVRYDTTFHWKFRDHIVRIDTFQINTFTLYGGRPRTGEEIRLMATSAVFFGAKGLIYWFKSTSEQFWSTEPYLGLKPPNPLIPSNVRGDSLLKWDGLGGDYILGNGDSTIADPNGFDAHYNQNHIPNVYVYATMDIDSNHIYIGLTSTRMEMSKLHKWIKNNESTMLNLKLQAWFGKGFLKLYNQDPNLTDTAIIRNYVNIDGILTRPPERYENDQPLYEQHTTIDSGFYDITLFKDTRSSIENEFIITAQNRRTDPLVEITSADTTGHPLPNRSVGFNFIPSAEFDQLCDGADSTFWRSKYFSRLGCREIRLPFNYQNPSAPSQRYILKIQELIDSSAYNNNWSYWRKEKWNRKIDTLIMDDEDLVLNFLPGEGRMFKVQIIPKLDFTGELDYSAQNKMVVYPTHQNSQKDFSFKDSSVYYHLVYHKFDSTAGYYNVYYRRSVPTFPSLRATNIEWEATEYKISRVQRIKPVIEPLKLTQDAFQNSNDGCNCKFPTITVRFDSVSNEVMAYILYNCKRIWATDSLKNYVVETVFPANYIGTPSIPDTSNVIEFAYIGDLNNPQGKWGVPTINASYSGNYYAWADSIRGIMVGWKSPNDRDVITTKASIISGGATTKHLNPNFNTYSRMLVEENSCSLVWEGDSPSVNQIFYTRISRNGRGIITPSIYQVRIDTSQDAFNSSYRYSTYAVFQNLDTQFPTFPSIHKPVSYKLRSGYETADSIHFAKNGWDRVVFMDKYDDPTHKDIYIKAIDYSDSMQAENHLPTTRIASLENRLLYPFITQGNISRTDSTFHQMVGRDSSLILTFTEQTPITNNVYQYNLDFWSPFLDPTTWDWSPRALFLTNSNDINPNYLHNIGVGNLAHPSNSPITNRKEDFWLTRTVFQHNGLIKGPSQKLIYKGGSQKKVATRFIGFNSNESPKSSSITPILFDDGNYLSVNYGEILANKRLILYDTMRTDWFKINEIKKFGFTYFSLDSNSFKMYIQKQSDRTVFEISPQFAKKKAKINRITCINGRNENYRLIFVKNDASFMTNENIVLGYEDEFINRLNFLEEEPLFKQAESNSQVINLNPEDIIHDSKLGLSVYPNPANDELYVICYLPRTQIAELKSELNLKLYDNLGKEVYSKQIKAGQIVRLPTSNFRIGNYFVKVFQNDQTLLPAEVRNVMIER